MFIDKYCQHYSLIFEDFRIFEKFKHLHLGMLFQIRSKRFK